MLAAWCDTFFILHSGWSDPHANPCVGKSTTTVIGDKPIRPAHPPPQKIYFPPLITPPPEHPLISPAQCYLSIRRIYGTQKNFFFFSVREGNCCELRHRLTLWGRERWEWELGRKISAPSSISSQRAAESFSRVLSRETPKSAQNKKIIIKYFVAIVWNLKIVEHFGEINVW